MKNNPPIKLPNDIDIFLERRELVQDVVDRLLSVDGYKEKLKEFNAQFQPKDYNRNLTKSRNEDNALSNNNLRKTIV